MDQLYGWFSQPVTILRIMGRIIKPHCYKRHISFMQNVIC